MTTSAEWQCRNCGNHPSNFSDDLPTSGENCPVSGKHVWMRLPAGSNKSRDWQCMHCGVHPTRFTDSRPNPADGCTGTGYKHVWIQL